jgi:aryl-alcohol dehydrogenase-like predicted oxidoreductase
MQKNDLIKKLVLGSAQFGINYGIANSKGKVKTKEIKKIINLSKKKGVLKIDTAISYGSSQKDLGKNNLDKFKIITKLPNLPLSIREKDISQWVESKIRYSLKELNVKKIYGLLFHEPQNLLDKKGKQLFNSVNNLKNNGLIDKIGISVNNFKILRKLVGLYSFQIVQVPFNILDRRVLKFINLLKRKKIKIYARSIFLQGLLLSERIFRKKKFSKWKKIWDQWELYNIKNNNNYLYSALSFVVLNKKIDYIIIGVDNSYNLKEIIKNINLIKKSDKKFKFLANTLVCADENLINPSMW